MNHWFLDNQLLAWPWPIDEMGAIDEDSADEIEAIGIVPDPICDFLMVESWRITASYVGSAIPSWTWSGIVPAGGYRLVSDSEDVVYGGWGSIDEAIEYSFPPDFPVVGTPGRLILNTTDGDYDYNLSIVLQTPGMGFAEGDPDRLAWGFRAVGDIATGFASAAELSFIEGVADTIVWWGRTVSMPVPAHTVAGWEITVEPESFFEE